MLPKAADSDSRSDTAPIADWTPEQQIAHMLELCEAQMESALSESDLAVDALIRAFSGLVDNARALAALTGGFAPEGKRGPEGIPRETGGFAPEGKRSPEGIPRETGELSPEQRQAATGSNSINEQIEAIARQMSSAIVAFQFYDKLTQRLGHVRYSLSSLAMFVCDRAQTRQREQWHRLFTTLKRLYRTEEERQIFQMMVEGATAEEARDHIHQTTATIRIAASGDIELF